MRSLIISEPSWNSHTLIATQLRGMHLPTGGLEVGDLLFRDPRGNFGGRVGLPDYEADPLKDA